MNITTISARVMRSFDYSHFEITLGATYGPGATDDPVKAADDLRKTAARLADKAVAQYKIAKVNAARLKSESREHRYDLEELQRIGERPETDRTPEEQAKLKAHNDKIWEANRRYDYQDQWDDDDGGDA